MQDELNALSPLDGRYREITLELCSFYSEQSFFYYRIRVEVEYFLALTEIPLKGLESIPLDKLKTDQLRNIYRNFNHEEAKAIKLIEKKTNHDVKAIEYYLKQRFDNLNLGAYKEFVHFGLTSQDINNTAIPFAFKESLQKVIIPILKELIRELQIRAEEWHNIPMLAYTHGQVASPTRMGKEIRVFIERIEGQIKILDLLPDSAKFGGATGNFNAHHIAYPNVDWVEFADRFINEKFGLIRSRYTTQIDHYDQLAAKLDTLKRINTILIDLCRDIWQYISMHYFGQYIIEGEVGSSAMPHKVNPIDFENAEGNLGLANAILEHLSAKLPISRLQRDLTDSTVLRNLGVPLGHALIAYKAIKKGLSKLFLNPVKINQDLEHNWVVVAEAIQTILRREGYPEPYEKLKELTRNQNRIDKEIIHYFIDSLTISQSIKDELKKISPFNYTGI